MKRGLVWAVSVAVVILCARPGETWAGPHFEFDVGSGDLTYRRQLDPGGGGFVYVLDQLHATYDIPATPVTFDTYRVQFRFEQPVEYQPQLDRIDLAAALGSAGTYSFALASGIHQANAAMRMENLPLPPGSPRTAVFADAGIVVGIGADYPIFAPANFATDPQLGYRLASLDFQFTITRDHDPFSFPPSPATTINLVLGAGKRLPGDEVAALPPLLSVAEPGAVVPAMAVCALLLRRRGGHARRAARIHCRSRPSHQ